MNCADHIPATEKLGYIEWHDRAAAAVERGEKQTRCDDCGLFWFPWERAGAANTCGSDPIETMRVALANAEARGHEWVQLKVARARSPKNWDRVRVIPGLYGICRGELGPEQFLIDVRTSDMHRVLGRKARPSESNTNPRGTK